MPNQILKTKDIAYRFAWEIEKRLLALPELPVRQNIDSNVVMCQRALVIGAPLVFSSQDLCGTLDNLVARLREPLDETAEIIKAVSRDCQPVFLTPPELPGGLDMSEHGRSGFVNIRFVRGYNIQDNSMLARIDCHIIAAKWGNSYFKPAVAEKAA